MYHEAGIQALSPKQVSRLLNGHPVRVKSGSHSKLHLSSEQHKKLGRAHLKGSALTVTLDPYAIEKNLHLRIPKYHPIHQLPHHGAGPKGLKKFEKWTAAIGDFLKPVAKPILSAATDAAVKNINAYGDASASQASMMGNGAKRGRKSGTGPKGLKKFQKWTAAIGDVLKPVAKPILSALTEQAVKNIDAYGDAAASQASMGGKLHRPKRVMSEKQKAALAKGRHALRLKLEQMGAGPLKATRKQFGSALLPGGYGIDAC